MVFESIVTDLLNKYLGQYVQNLDSSQLKIGIWGGNVVLESLELKDTALDDLDLPIKVVRGFLGKLTLSIPWKNLYNESTVVEIEDLHILSRPNFDIKYNKEREEKAVFEKKKKQIENIEEARRIEEEKKSAKKDKPDEDNDSFAEKLATNIVKNLQISIKNIHIRYEDSVSDPASPFAVGLTLENLSAQTTDGNFIPQVIKESVTIINKLVKLDNLAMYWNSNQTGVDNNMGLQDWLDFSRSGISSSANQPNMKYILKPIVASKKLKINTKPGLDMNIPKFFMNLLLEELGVVVFHSQYHGIVQLLQSFERMTRNQPFRKYRPPVPCKNNARTWWKYCIESILEEDIKRQSNMWSWNKIKEHRALCKSYQQLFKEKLEQKSPSSKLLSKLEVMETQLNVTSITIYRQLAERDFLREKKKKEKSSFFGFFGSRGKEKEKKVAGKIEELMGFEADEMTRLYEAIGYTENEKITTFPAHYVAIVFKFELKRISITLKDDTKVGENEIDVLRFMLDGITVDLQQRPSAQALRVLARMDTMKLYGTPTVEEIPCMIRNITQAGGECSMVNLSFETNPLERPNIDQWLKLDCQPLEIVYDANSINRAISFFEPPEDVILKDLQNKAYSTFEEFKETSTSGLLYAMEQRKILDMEINIAASYLIIPERGTMVGCKDMIVVDFGSLHFESDPSQVRELNPKDIDNIEEVQEKAYDRFLLKLNHLQLLLCMDGENLQTVRRDPRSKSHILHPLSFEGKIAKSIVPNDPRIKGILVSGELSSIELEVSDNKISRTVKLFDNLPLPHTKEPALMTDDDSTRSVDSFIMDVPSRNLFSAPKEIPLATTLSTMIDEEDFHTPPEESILSIESTGVERQFSSGIANHVKVELSFEIKQLRLAMSLTDKSSQQERQCLEIDVNNIGADVSLRRWDMFVTATIGQFVLTEMTWGDELQPLQLFRTPDNANMLTLSYRKCEFDQSLNLGASYFYSEDAQLKALHYRDEFQSTQQVIDVQMAMLDVVLHQEAILTVMSLITQILEPLEKTHLETLNTDSLKKSLSVAGSKLNLAFEEHMKSNSRDSKTQTAIDDLANKVGLAEETKLKVTAKLEGLSVLVCSSRGDLAHVSMSGLYAEVLMQESKTQVKANMTDLLVLDKVGCTNFSKIVSMQSEEVFSIELLLFNNATSGENQFNMSAVDLMLKLNVGQMCAVFLNRFVRDILAFVDHFEDAKRKIIEAGVAAKERAAHAVTHIRHHSTRNKLNLTIKAPVVIVPVHSLSELALLVDLGELRIYNNFKVLNKDKRPKEYVILDEITIKMSDLKLQKALIKDGTSIIAQRALIEPMTLKLGITRNLTLQNHSVADIDVQGALKAITLQISEEDISVALKIVKGNIAEGQLQAEKMSKKKALTHEALTAMPQNPPDRLADIYEEPSDVVYKATSFKFDLEKIALQVYLKPPDMTFEEEFLERDSSLFLSEFTIGHFGVTGAMMSDNSINVYVTLDTLQLDDKRPISLQTLTRMMDCCPEPLVVRTDLCVSPSIQPKKLMIELKYDQSSKGDRNIEMSINNLMTILNVEFLMVVLHTMLATIPREGEDEASSTNSSPTHSVTSSDDDDLSYTTDLDETIHDSSVGHPQTRVQLNVNNPQIVLLADAKDVRTNALFFTTVVNFQYLEVSNVQKMMGTVSNMEVFSTAFSKDYRTDISSVLLLEMINLHSSAPIGGKPHMHVNTTVIKLSIAPKTVRTISACVNQTVMPETIEMVRENQRAMSELWNFRDITEKKLWYLNTPPQHVLGAGSFVLARTSQGPYAAGFLAKKDTHFMVYFYPEGSISHSVSDVTSVVVDTVPAENQIVVGDNVVAMHSEMSGYQTAKVLEIWSNEPDIGMEMEVEEVATDVVNEPSPRSDESTMCNKYLVHYYFDCSEQYVVAENLRPLPVPGKGSFPGLGACVYARFVNGFYYRGTVESIKDHRASIYLTEIDDEVTHDVDDLSSVILNITPREIHVKKQCKVIAVKAESEKGYHPGKVVSVQGSRGYRNYKVRFEDGSMNQIPISKLLLVPSVSHDALPTVGTYVYSRVARDSALYEKGIVADLDERIYVKHLNGRKLAHDRQNIGFVIRNIVPHSAALRVGQEVIAQVDNDDLKMYLGEITDTATSSKGKKFVVRFTDGSVIKTSTAKIRIVPRLGSVDVQQETQSSSLLAVSRREHLIVEVEGVSLRIEGYLGGQLTPMLRFESKMHAELFDWSSKLSAEATLSLHATYYNETVAEWEPFIEPIAQGNRERPWQMALQYVTEDDIDQEAESSLLQKPMTSLKASSSENLELVLTKASLTLLQNLGKVFGDAYACSDDMVTHTKATYQDPFVIQNKMGKKVTITLNELLQTYEGTKEIVLETSTPVGFEEVSKEAPIMRSRRKMPIINVEVEGYHVIKNVAVKRQRTVIYDLRPIDIMNSKGAYSVIIDISTNDGQRKIVVRTALQIKNYFPLPLDLIYTNNQGEEVLLAKIPSQYAYAVPLLPAYHANFYLKPSGFGYGNSSEQLIWSDLVEHPRKLLVCFNPDPEQSPFYIQLVVKEERYTSVHGMLDAVPKYLIHCYPPITLHNYLPYPIKYQVEGMVQFEDLFGGNNWPLFTLSTEDRSVVQIKIPDYFNKEWSGNIVVSGIEGNSKISTFSLENDEENHLELGAYTSKEGGVHVTLYCPYWLLNKTGKSLVYQAVGSRTSHSHPADKDQAVLFHIRGKKAKKARICVQNCEWSDEFSLDTVNSGGSVKSEGLRGRIFEIGVGISLSYFGLTKIVTFTPLRILTNHTKYVISMAEKDSESSEWHTVKPDESVPYWPTILPPQNLFLNINGSATVTFNPLPGHNILLKSSPEIGGICVNYQEKDSSSLLSFKPYFEGAAPVRIENMCKKISMISYKQADFNKGHVLLFGQSVLYTWDDPTLAQELTCAIIEKNESQTKIKLDANDFGRMKCGENGAIYWVSFLDGLQRVLMFTDNFKSAYCAKQEQTLRPTQEIDIYLEGLGVSLVNGEKRMEIAYLAIQKSQVIWEQLKNGRWKSLPLVMCEGLEGGYTKHSKGSREKVLQVEVDFETMFITKPEKIKIRRTFHSGLGFQYIVSPNRMQISATISSIQFDSHIPGSTFTTIVHEVEPPKSVVSDSAPKPFFELSLTANIGDGNVVHEISYLKVLIQEMDIRIDKGFLFSIIDLFSSESIRGSESTRYNYDMIAVAQKLEESSEFQAAKKEKHYIFNFFHMSPLKIHVSFSMTGGHSLEERDAAMVDGNVLGLLLQSVGVAFTEIQDVEFKLACFEVQSCLLSTSQLSDSILKHYQTQAIKQLYVLVLGLDVLGNPYGLITGVSAGAKNFFYEPYQGLIQGPEEFAEGLAYGVKSLVGGTLGGVSGAVSKITGTVGKGLAALTMDDDYQQKRRQQMSQRPTNLGQGLAKGGKGLVKGIFSGVTGIVVKPYEGAKKEGTGGFFKGIGKGLVGVVARPVGGVVDMASSTFDGLKSTTSGVKSVERSRVTRVFHADKVLRSFNEYEAAGNRILMQGDKGIHAKSHYYMTHLYPVDKKCYLILTNKAVILFSRNEVLLEWEAAWKLPFDEVKGDPSVEDNVITFQLHLALNRKSVFKKAITSRVVTVQNEAVAKWFVEKYEDAKML